MECTPHVQHSSDGIDSEGNGKVMFTRFSRKRKQSLNELSPNPLKQFKTTDPLYLRRAHSLLPTRLLKSANRVTSAVTISCSELAEMLSVTRSGPLNPLILDIRSLSSQSYSRIREAIGMPCESEIKLRLILPVLDAYLRDVTKSDATQSDTCVPTNRMVVVCTDSELSQLSSSRFHVMKLMGYLENEYQLTVRLINGGFSEFQNLFPHLCERSVGHNCKLLDGVILQFSESCERDTSKANPVASKENGNYSWSSTGAGGQRSTVVTSVGLRLLALPDLNSVAHAHCSANSLDHWDTTVSGPRVISRCTQSCPSSTTEYSTYTKATHRESKNVYFAKISEILPFLYLGNEMDGHNAPLLSSHRIKYVLNVTERIPFLDELHFQCCRLMASDSAAQDLRPLFKQAFEFIEDARRSGSSILVHCQAGISRSPTLVMAYLMVFSTMTLRDAYCYVKSKRKIVSPNFAFLSQLSDLESDLLAGRMPRKSDVLTELFTYPHVGETNELEDDLFGFTSDAKTVGVRE